MADRKSIDKKFLDSYRTDPRTLQPSTGGVQVRNVQTEEGYDPKKRRGGVSARAASTLGEGMQATGAKMQQSGTQKNQSQGIRSVATEQYQNAGKRIARTGKSLKLAGRRVRGRKKLSAAGVTHRWVGRGVTLGIWSWGFWTWMFFQLPFAILSILFMAMAEAIYQLSLEITPDAGGSFATSAIANGVKEAAAILLTSVLAVVNAVMNLVLGFDTTDLNPANLFMLTYVLVIFFGWGTLLAIGIIYTSTGQKAFSGRGAGGKNAMFLLALFAYPVPILNLFPWFFLWTLMVLKNPR